MATEPRPKPGYFRAAFANVYNLSLLGGTAFAAAATGDWWLLGVGLAAEALWLLFSTDNPRFRRAVDAKHEQEMKLWDLQRLSEQAAALPTDQRLRVERLRAKVAELKHEASRNRRLTGDFIASQLDRLDALHGEFTHLAVSAHRAREYLARSDAKQINREREQHRLLAENAPDDGAREIARQNKELLEKRLVVIEEVARFATRANGQLSLIENTVSLLRDQVMTMATPEALSTQLDSVVASVEAIKDATLVAEAIVEGRHVPEPVSAPFIMDDQRSSEIDKLLAASLEAGAPAQETAEIPAGRANRRNRGQAS